MDKYYRNSDGRAGPYQRMLPRASGQDVLYNPIPSRFSHGQGVQGIDRARFSNQPFLEMYENMAPVKQQYLYMTPNIPNVHDCPNADIYEAVSYFAGYGSNSEDCNSAQQSYRQNTPEYSVPHRSRSPAGLREPRPEPAPSRRRAPAASGGPLPEAAGHVEAAGSGAPVAGNQSAQIARNNLTQPSSAFFGPTTKNTDSVPVASTETGHPSEVTSYKAVQDKQKNTSSGLRLLTGSVEKVLKWHKALQDSGVSVMFEVIAKCVSVRPGPGCEKLLLLRDAAGPVLQATYYEIDFLLPEIRPGSTIRLVGSMVGCNRMRALKVRPAAAFEPAALPRLSAISQHVVAKLTAQRNRQ